MFVLFWKQNKKQYWFLIFNQSITRFWLEKIFLLFLRLFPVDNKDADWVITVCVVITHQMMKFSMAKNEIEFDFGNSFQKKNENEKMFPEIKFSPFLIAIYFEENFLIDNNHHQKKKKLKTFYACFSLKKSKKKEKATNISRTWLAKLKTKNKKKKTEKNLYKMKKL